MLFSWEHLKYQTSHPQAHFGTGLGEPWGWGGGGGGVVNLGIPSGLYISYILMRGVKTP